MSDVQDDSDGRPSFSDADTLVTVTRRGTLVPTRNDGVLELDMKGERVELLGPFTSPVAIGEEVEVVGVLIPEAHTTQNTPGILVREVRPASSG